MVHIQPIETGGRTYRPADYRSRAFGIGATHPYDIFLVGDGACTYIDLVLPDGYRVHFINLSGSGLTGTFEHTETPTIFYKATLTFTSDQSGPWVMVLKDGTILQFGDGI